MNLTFNLIETMPKRTKFSKKVEIKKNIAKNSSIWKKKIAKFYSFGFFVVFDLIEKYTYVQSLKMSSNFF